MYRQIKIILFPVLTLWIITSCATEKGPLSDLHVYPVSSNISDTVHGGLLRIDPFYLDILPPSSGIQFYRDGIIFLASSKNQEKMLSKHLSFGADMAYTASIQDTIPGQYELFSPSLIFSYPCDAITFSNDFKTMYFTGISEADDKEKIYKAEYSSDGNTWSYDMTPMDFCNTNFVFTHPALSADGEIMIFASDNTGSFGGLDLFITRKQGNKWSEPENLGIELNTEGNELYPFLDPDNNLFFSSDGLPGYGGYDIFISRYNGKEWGKPENVSQQINSRYDDVAFTANRKNGKSAFFTTKERSGKGEMQLFRITLDSRTEVNDSTNLTGLLYGMALLVQDLPERVIKPKAEIAIVIPEKPEIKPPEEKVIAELKKETKVEPKRIVFPGIKECTVGVVYKVQIYSSIKPKGTVDVTIDGQKYTTFEYLHLNEYRSAIGEFTTLKPAIKLQYACRRSGYPQAFVVAFKNEVRSNDLELFKK